MNDSKTIYETKVYQVRGREETLVDHPANWGTPDRQEAMKIFENANRQPNWRKNSKYVIRLTEIEVHEGFRRHYPFAQLNFKRDI